MKNTDMEDLQFFITNSEDESELDQRIYDSNLAEWGLLDSDQPTKTSHNDHIRKMRKPFNKYERQMIRGLLGLNYE